MLAICSTSSGLAARPRGDDREGEVVVGREKKKYRMARPESTRTIRSCGMLMEVSEVDICGGGGGSVGCLDGREGTCGGGLMGGNDGVRYSVIR